MVDQRVKAYLNLHAVLPNLMDLVALDPVSRDIVSGWKRSILFVVPGGPAVQVRFRDGVCVVTPGVHLRSSIILGFVSSAHLNRMIDGGAVPPIVLRGIASVLFLHKHFPKITDRLEYYLKPTPELLQDPEYLELNTLLTLMTAARASAVLSRWDSKSQKSAARIRDGVVQLEVGTDGPRVHLESLGGVLTAHPGAHASPSARMHMKDVVTANRFLSGQVDPFTAIAAGDVRISGQTSMLDNLSLVLDRVEHYLA